MNRVTTVWCLAAVAWCMMVPAYAADEEQVIITGFVPAPQGIFNRLVFERAWDYAAGDVSYLSMVDWYVDPNGITRLRSLWVTGGTPPLSESPPREPAGTNVQLRMGNNATVAAEDVWIDKLEMWVSEIGDASSCAGGCGGNGGGDGDWQIDGANNMYNLNSGQFVRIGPGPGYQAAPGAPPGAKTVDVNGELVVRTPHGITLGGVRRTTWPQALETRTTPKAKNPGGNCAKGADCYATVTCPVGYQVTGCSGWLGPGAGGNCNPSSGDDCLYKGTWVEGNGCKSNCERDDDPIYCWAQAVCYLN